MNENPLDFYVVWGAGIPIFRHQSYVAAEQEAIRLLKKDPHQTFHVMRCCAEIRIGDAIITRNVPAIPLEFALKGKATTKKTTTKKEK